MIIITPEELKQRIDSGEKLELIDVREPWEFQADHIESSVNIPVSNFTIKSFEPDISKESQVITICEHGVRSEFARRVLAEKGYRVLSLDGGMDLWRQHGYPSV